MSIIHLCSIPEFSSDYKDVLSFENEENQQEFMNTKIIMSAETNTKLDNLTQKIVVNVPMSSDLRQCDYLFCMSTDNSKQLFFFIDNMEMLTPSTSQLILSLDVWQTYHLSLELMTSYVERMHVKRWDTDGYPTKEVVTEPINVGEMTLTRTTPRVRTDQGNYIYVTTSPIGLVTKDK